MDQRRGVLVLGLRGYRADERAWYAVLDAAGSVTMIGLQPKEWEEWYCRICRAAWVEGRTPNVLRDVYRLPSITWQPSCDCRPECECPTGTGCDFYGRPDEIGEYYGWLPQSRIRNTITVRKPGPYPLGSLRKWNHDLIPTVIHRGRTDFGSGGVVVLAFCGLTVLRRATNYDSRDDTVVNCPDCRRQACLPAVSR